MAATVEGAFVLLDRASPKLREIRREARATDRQLSHLGKTLDGVGTPTQIRGMDRAGKSIRNLSREASNMEKSVTKGHRSLVILGNRLGPLGRAFDGLAGSLTSVGRGLFSLGAAHPLIAIFTALIPVVVQLGIALGGLVVSLGAAVGGGITLAGGLLGSFAVGLGTMFAAVKPAIGAITEMKTAQENLNKAIQEGADPATIRRYQQQVDAIEKMHPGVQALTSEVTALGREWNKLARPAQNEFFKLAESGIKTVRGMLPQFASEAQKNLQTVREAFEGAILPGLRSRGFRNFFHELNSIFRANIPGFSKGIVSLGKALSGILKIADPVLRGFGQGFADMMKDFNKFVHSKDGEKFFHNMIESFGAWMHLIGSVLKLFGKLILFMGSKGKKDGTDVIESWADGIDHFTNSLKRADVAKFFDDAFSKSGKFLTAMFQLVEVLWKLMPALNAIAESLASIVEAIPPDFLAGLLTVGAARFVMRHDPLKGKGRGSTGGGGGFPGGVPGRPGTRGGGTPRGGAPRPGETVGERIDRQANRGPAVGAPPPGLGGRARAAAAKRFPKTAGVAGKAGGLLGKVPGLKAVAPILREFPLTAAIFAAIGAANSPWAGAQGAAAGGISALDPTWLLGMLPGPTHGFKGVAHTGFDALFKAQGPGLSAPPAEMIKDNAENVPLTFIKKMLDKGKITAQGSTGAATQAQNLWAQKSSKMGRNAITGQPLGVGGLGIGGKDPLGTGALADAAGKDVDKTTKKFDEIPKKSKEAADKTTKNFDKLEKQIKKNMDAASGSVTKGTSAIMRQLQNALAKIGVRMEGTRVGPGRNERPSSGTRAGGPRAHGGRLGGSGLQDNVALGGGNVAAPGELILNRHTENRVDKKLAMFGTNLNKEVSGETKPHSEPLVFHAKGGRTPGGRTGGGPYPDAMGALPGLDALAFFLKQRFSLNVVSGSRPGAITTSGNPSDHGWGGAIDVSNGVTTPQMDAAARWVAGLGGFAFHPGVMSGGPIKQMLYRTMVGGNHFNHVHVALQEQYAHNAGLVEALVAGKGGGAMGAGAMAGGLQAPHIKGQPGAGAGQFGQAAQGALNKVRDAAQKKANKSYGKAGGGPMTGGGAPNANMQLAQQMMAQYGWGPGEFGALRELWERESGWSQSAHNPSSGAHGIPQALPASKMASAGADYMTNPATQIKWGLGYIKERYRTPSAALAFHNSHNWYSQGGRIPWFGEGADFIANKPQLIGVGDSQERVQITPKGGRGGAGGIKIGNIHIQNHRPGDIKKQMKKEIASAFDDLTRELDYQPMIDEQEASGIG